MNKAMRLADALPGWGGSAMKVDGAPKRFYRGLLRALVVGFGLVATLKS